MAHITTFGSGRDKQYKVTYEINSVDGSRKRKSKSFPKGTPKTVVDDFVRKVEYDYRVGELDLISNHSDITLLEFYEDVYLKQYSLYLSPSTLKSYKCYFEGDKPYSIRATFGVYKLARIKRSDIQAYLNRLHSNGLSSKTVRAYYSILRTIFDKAILSEYLPPSKNPMTNILLPPKESIERNAFTAEQLSQLIEKARAKGLNDLAIVELGGLAGLRRSEIAALRFEDFDGEMLHIRHAKLTVDHKLIMKSTKTRSSVRDIPIGNELKNTLNLLKEDYLRRKSENPNFIDSEFFLTNEDGSEKSPATISTIYQRLIQSMPEGFPRYGLHCLRHTVATLLITSGSGDLKSVSQMLGHSNVQTTLDIYTHSVLENKRKALENLDNMINSVS